MVKIGGKEEEQRGNEGADGIGKRGNEALMELGVN